VKLGLFGINMNACALDPTVLARAAVAAEQAGWDSVWTGEHYVLPAEFVPPSPAPPDTPMLDPFVALAAVAAHTSALLLGTGVTVVPLHQSMALAKRVASLDVMSGGRFLFGVGVGYLEPEFRALDAPFDHRGRRLMDHLAAMRAIWTEESFEGVRAEPRPVQSPGPPLHFGGYVTDSYRRAVTHGHGWYGFALELPAIEHCLAELRSVAASVERPDELPPLEVSVTPHPRMPLDPETVLRLSELGVDRLILLQPRSARTDGDELLRFVEEEPARLQ
jgi:probable F420-dependent oxidoreductase